MTTEQWVKEIAAKILRQCDILRRSHGYREDDNSYWVGPSLHNIEDLARALWAQHQREERA